MSNNESISIKVKNHSLGLFCSVSLIYLIFFSERSVKRVSFWLWAVDGAEI